ncbi:MAG: hypothetical protein H3C57_07855 [Gammaproteobacteria bacterium]|nr:hypothetical protein [Gammaproteobacteria bacterium]
MAGRKRKSTKRSAASSRQPEPTLFLDRSLGRYVVAERLRAAGARVEIHDDHFPQDAPDEEWLAAVGRKGWAVLTKDAHIRYRHNELSAAVGNGVRLFVLGKGQLTGEEIAGAFVTALPAIRTLLGKEQGTFIVRVSAQGRLTKPLFPGAPRESESNH